MLVFPGDNGGIFQSNFSIQHQLLSANQSYTELYSAPQVTVFSDNRAPKHIIFIILSVNLLIEAFTASC